MNDLLKWVTPDEIAAEFLTRQRREALATGLPFIDSHVKLRPGHVLELVGPTGSAKTEILIEVIFRSVDSLSSLHQHRARILLLYQPYLLLQVAANIISRDTGSANSSDQGRRTSHAPIHVHRV